MNRFNQTSEDRLTLAREKVNEHIKMHGCAEIYVHLNSQTYLTEQEKAKFFDEYRTKGYNITPKKNSHGVTYFRIR